MGGVNVKVKRPIGWAASQVVVSRETWAEWLSRMTSIAVSGANARLTPRGIIGGGPSVRKVPASTLEAPRKYRPY